MIVQDSSARFQIGDKVRVISHDPTDFTQQWWNTRMQRYKGRELTISDVGADEHGFFYDVFECNETFDERWLNPIDFLCESDEELESLELSFLVSGFRVVGGI